MSSLATRVLPATAEALLAEPLVLLHGWGCDSRSWEPILESLNQFCDLIVVDLPGFAGSSTTLSSDPRQQLELWVDQLLMQLPSRAAYLGWSLGGMLATHIALLYPERVSRLLTLATNSSFVAREHWPEAMGEPTFTGFLAAFAETPELALKRFCGLMARGDSQEKNLLKALRPACLTAMSDAGSEAPGHWLQALEILALLDNSRDYASLAVPGLHILGADDQLVPAAVAPALAAAGGQQVAVVAGSAHAPHWSQPQQVVTLIHEHFRRARYAIDKRRVALSFSRAARTYDSVADLQRQVGNHLFDRLPALQASQLLLDLGSGTGYFSGPLSKSCIVVGLDIAEGMLQFARAQHEGVQHWLCADAESIPLADACVDVIFSSLAIQWCTQTERLFAEIRRILKPGGQFFIATLGPDTLCELRQAWQQVDHYAHVNQFAAVSELQAGLQAAGLDAVEFERQTITLAYRELRELTHELKALGAHNMNGGQSSGLTGRARVQAFRQAYEGFRRADGSLPATYDVVYLYGRKT